MNCCQKMIKNILIFGLGGVGTVYADLISKNPNVNMKILVDNERLLKYNQSPRLLNNLPCKFEYITQNEKFHPDLIIIATKSTGLNTAINMIKPFVDSNTLIMSFINGISSEQLLSEHFNPKQIIHSYIICHTITRNGNNITHDGITKVVWGDKHNNIANINLLKNFFKVSNIDNELADNIIKSLWEKFCFNCCVNQISAITGYTFEQMWNNQDCLQLMHKISEEINTLAQSYGLKDINLIESTRKNLDKMIPEGKTSMLQDIENNRIPEYELFSAEVIKLAKLRDIPVTQNQKLYDTLIEKLKQKKLL